MGRSKDHLGARRASAWSRGAAVTVLGLGLAAFLVLPVLALLLAGSPAQLGSALRHPMLLPALALSVRTSVISLLVVVIAGTPLAWWLARTQRRWGDLVETAIALPIVVPPAVIGIGLLLAFGREGLFGPALSSLGLSVPFTSTAVVMAQVAVAAPFYVQSAAAGFRGIDDDLLLVARTLGASPARVVVRVALPLAWPALVSGAALAWARAIGEFGATLLFAGNFPGRTQTMPLAIYAALEIDVEVASAIALLLALLAFSTLLIMRVATRRGRT